jgi:hypothetical protein
MTHNHLIIVPLEQFFDNEPKFNEVQVIPEKQLEMRHTNITSLRKSLAHN